MVTRLHFFGPVDVLFWDARKDQTNGRQTRRIAVAKIVAENENGVWLGLRRCVRRPHDTGTKHCQQQKTVFFMACFRVVYQFMGTIGNDFFSGMAFVDQQNQPVVTVQIGFKNNLRTALVIRRGD